MSGLYNRRTCPFATRSYPCGSIWVVGRLHSGCMTKCEGECERARMQLSLLAVDDLCADVAYDVSKPTLDLSDVSFVEPGGLVYLGMFLRHFNSLGKYFNIVSPRAPAVVSYLNSQRFWERYHISGSGSDSHSFSRHGRFTSLRDIIDIENDQWIADEVGTAVADILRENAVKVEVDLIAEVVIELVDNFSRHSGEQLAACAMQFYRRRGKLHFAVGDCGVGIRRSLARNPRHANMSNAPHHEAAVKALEDGVTGSIEGGTGFGTIREDVLELGGEMSLCTGDGWVRVGTRHEGVQSGTMRYDLPGVQVEVVIPVKI